MVLETMKDLRNGQSKHKQHPDEKNCENQDKFGTNGNQ